MGTNRTLTKKTGNSKIDARRQVLILRPKRTVYSIFFIPISGQ